MSREEASSSTSLSRKGTQALTPQEVFPLSSRNENIILYWSLDEPILLAPSTYIARSMNLYCSLQQAILVAETTYIGSANDQYSFSASAHSKAITTIHP